ncbi:MAG: DUF4129 domain-containing protein [Gammaproteobacteria bacterium]|jgi:hypothetical protein
MRARTYAILIACLLALCEPGSAGATESPSTLALVQDCLGLLQNTKHPPSPGQAITLSESCPQLSISLDRPQLAQLEPALQDITSVRQLTDVARILQSRQQDAALSQAPAIKDVRHILGQVYHPKKQTKPKLNFFERVMHWIDQKIQAFLKRHHWLSDQFHLNSKSSLSLLRGFLSTVLVLLVVFILYIVVNELRIAGVMTLFKRHRHTSANAEDALTVTGATTAQAMETIKTLPLNQQIPALMRYTLQFLIEKQVLPHRYNLTNREFLGLLRDKLPAAKQDFEQLVTCNEQVVYGKKTLADNTTDQLYGNVRHIQQLSSGDRS